MTIGHPWLLLLGLGLSLLTLVGVRGYYRRRRRLAEFLGGAIPTRRLSGSHLGRVRWNRVGILVVALLAMSFAAAELAVTERSAPGQRPEREVVLALDVSASMQASDIPPTRLARGVEVAKQVLEELSGDRVGLVLFSGSAYTLAPPTRDHSVLRYLLEGMTPTIASSYDPGSLLSVGIRESSALLLENAHVASTTEPEERTGPLPSRALVVVSDGEAGEEPGAVRDAAEAAAEEGIALFTVGVGTSAGGQMVLPAGYLGGPVRDESGQLAVSRFEEETLIRIAEIGGGSYGEAGGRGAVESQSGVGVVLAGLRSLSPEPGEGTFLDRLGGGFEGLDLPFWLTGLALFCLTAESVAATSRRNPIRRQG